MRNLFALLSSTELATVILAASSYLTKARAFTFTRVPSANLDLSQIGNVGVVGDFDGVSLYQFAGQTQNPSITNGSTSLLSRYPTGAFATLQSSDASIQTMCPFILKDGTLAGVVIGGNFTSLGGVQANGIALFNVTSNQIVPLPGLNGKVSALYCDQNASMVYVGGSFSGGNSSNAIAWTTGWTNLPFAGFNGPVNSITKTSNGNIVFGGTFDGLGNTTTPLVRDSQVIPIGSGNITATPDTTAAGFSDPRNIICKTAAQDGPGNTWELPDNSPGSWSASFQFGFVPTRLRLYNTNLDGRGTKTWRYTALPINGIMNFSYVDPSGVTRYCDATCPLPQKNQTAQDFHFVNNVGMNAFRIDISEWYGAGAGLAGLELFQDDIYAFAINSFNEPACDGITNGSALATQTGSWTVTPSGISTSEYLTAQLTGNNISPSVASVSFKPNIKQSGNYSVTMFTPGCKQDNTCDTRGRVNITGVLASGSNGGPAQSISMELYQTNYFDKYDEIYNGRIDVSSDSFRPTITLQPSSGQNGPLTIVAQRVRADLKTSTGGLNGIYEYNPNQATVQTDFSQSIIDTAGTALSPAAIVNSLVVDGSNLYVAGSFSSPTAASVFSVGATVKDLGEGGLNGPVQAMILNSSVLYFAGSFNATKQGTTQGLKGVASYNISTSKWAPLGAGINGVASYVVPFNINLTSSNKPELAVAVSGTFDSVLAFGSNKAFIASNFAVWVPGRGNWLQNLNNSAISLKGILTAGTLVPNNPPLYAGSVASQELGASGAVELPKDGAGNTLQQFPVGVQHTQSSSASASKRAVTSGNVNGVVTGTYFSGSNLNLTIYGGHFAATATNGSVINNLLVINGSNSDQVTGLAAGISSSSTVQALAVQGTSLFTGGRISGNVNGKDVNGLFVYDLVTANYAATQPPALQGNSVSVNAIALQTPTASLVFVGGSFNSAGSFSCPSLCVFDTARQQWNSPGNGLGGAVAAMTWIDSTHLVLAGNLTLNGNSSTVIRYDSKAQQFTAIGGPPGIITTLTPGNQGGAQFWVSGTNTNGSALLSKYDGSTWQAAPALGAGSVIQGLQVFSTTQNHPSSSLLDQNNVLLAFGQLDVPNFGNASSAIFNGTSWTPWLLSVSGTGSGSMSQVFVQYPQNFFKSGRHFLAIGLVVLVALAIALAIIFLLVVAGIFAERFRRNRDGFMPLPQMPADRHQNMSRIPPEHLFGSVGPGGRGSAI